MIRQFFKLRQVPAMLWYNMQGPRLSNTLAHDLGDCEVTLGLFDMTLEKVLCDCLSTVYVNVMCLANVCSCHLSMNDKRGMFITSMLFWYVQMY